MRPRQPPSVRSSETAPAEPARTGSTDPFSPREAEAVTRPDPARGVYGISVAAELVGMGTQRLRLYESRGLLDPERTPGGTRRFSSEDLDRLRRIAQLLTAGLNLAGIAMVLELEGENTHLRTANHEHEHGPSSAGKPR